MGMRSSGVVIDSPATLPRILTILTVSFTMTDHLKSAPVAYENPAFLNSPDGRILRIMAEYQEPLARFRREQIQDTVVFFGSARFMGEQDAAKALAAIKQNHAGVAASQLEKDLKRAKAARSEEHTSELQS